MLIAHQTYRPRGDSYSMENVLPATSCTHSFAIHIGVIFLVSQSAQETS